MVERRDVCGKTHDLKDWSEIQYDHTSVIDLERLSRIYKQQAAQTEAIAISSNTNSGYQNEAEMVASEEVTEFVEQRLKQRTTETTTEGITFHIWDCGGQEVYYNTHHFFFTTKAIYVLVVDLSSDDFEAEVIERVEFWIRTIRSYAPKQV